METASLRGRRIVIDPGHGGTRSGTVSPYGLREADVNLDVARRLAARLRAAGAEVRLTRDADRDVAPADSPLAADLRARAAATETPPADLFLSIHHNATPYPDRSAAVRAAPTAWPPPRRRVPRTQATEVYWRALEGDGPSRAAAEEIAPRLAAALGTGRASVIPGNFLVLRATARPAVLGEAAYLSDERLARRLRWPGARDREAAAYLAGLAAYFARTDSIPPPPLPPPDTAPRDRPRILIDATGGGPAPADAALAGRLAARAAALAEALRAAGAEAEVVSGDPVEVLRREHVRRPDIVLSLADSPPAGLAGETAAVLVLHYPSSARGRAVAERIAAAAPGAARREAAVWVLVQTASPAVQIVGDVPPAAWAAAIKGGEP